MTKVKLLNANLRPNQKPVRLPGPLQITEYEWMGKKFLFESHTMALIEKPHGMSPEAAFASIGIHFPFEPPFPPPPKDMKVQTLVLEACQSCNLRCRYCFVAYEYEGGLTDKQGTRMPFKIAREAIDTLLDPKAKDPSIGFFGGEPLMNWPLIQKVVPYVQGKYAATRPPIKFHVTTNGTLLTPERAKFIGDNNFSLIVSLEGDKNVHNYNRPMASGKDSFEATMNGLRLLKEFAPKTTGSLTLRSTFPWHDRQGTLAEKLEFLNNLCDDGYAGWVSVEPAVLTEGCTKSPEADVMTFTPERVAELIPEYEEATKWFIERVKAGKKVRFHHFSKVVERIMYANHAVSECGAGKGYMSVGGDGKVYACHREQNSYIGQLGEDYTKEQEKWLDNQLHCKDKCPTCPIRFICGGGCREEAIGFHGMKVNGEVPAERAIKLCYPVMCAFKDLFVRASFYIISEVGAQKLAEVISDPQARFKVNRPGSVCPACKRPFNPPPMPRRPVVPQATVPQHLMPKILHTNRLPGKKKGCGNECHCSKK